MRIHQQLQEKRFMLHPFLSKSNFTFFLQHGFARNMNWSISDSEANEGDPAVTLELKDDSYSRSMWDFSFQALYKVKPCYHTMCHGALLHSAKPESYQHYSTTTSHQFQLIVLQVALHSTSLSTTLKITNTDDKPFSFNSALHSYFSVSCSFMKETKSYLFIKHIIVNYQVFGCTGFNFWCFSERSQRL